MSDSMRHSRAKSLCLLISLFLVMCAGGCAGPKIAVDLLDVVNVNAVPVTKSAVVIQATINPRINNFERIDDSVKRSLEVALAKANLFGTDSSAPYKIDANVTVASQAAMSFGSFNGKLEVVYTVRDQHDIKILTETIYTEAGSDQWHFSGAKRHRRARAVNISKNVLQFVEILDTQLNK